MNPYQAYSRIESVAGPEMARAISEVLGAMYEELKDTPTRADFQGLQETLTELGRIQLVTENRIGELVEAQKRTEARVEELAEAQKRTEARVEELVEAQKRTEARVDALAVRMEELAEAQKRTDETLKRLIEAVEKLEGRTGRLEGSMFEIEVAQKAVSFFAPVLRRTRLIHHEIEERLEGQLSNEEIGKVLLLDLIVSGRVEYEGERRDVIVAVELSNTVDHNDVKRAVERAALLRKAGLPAVPLAMGAYIREDVFDYAGSLHAALAEKRHYTGWDDAVRAVLN